MVVGKRIGNGPFHEAFEVGPVLFPEQSRHTRAVCRMHGAHGKDSKRPGRKPGCEKPAGSGGPAYRNQNNLRHGAYASRLSPEERELSEELQAAYEKDLAPLSETDRLSIQRLTFAEAKLMLALIADAPPAALLPLHRMMFRELEALKATREFVQGSKRTRGTTPAEVMGEILERFRRAGLAHPEMVDSRGRDAPEAFFDDGFDNQDG